MRIAIDATPLMKPNRTGVARYVVNLVRALAGAASDRDEFLLCYRLSRYSRRAFRLPSPGPGFRSIWVQGRYHPRGVDLVHGTDGRTLRWRGARSVTTLHDVFSLLSDEFSSPGFRKKRRRRYAETAEHADRILCVSSWTRDSFWQHHRVPEDRFVVIPEGVEDRFRPAARERVSRIRAKYGIEGPYYLFVGQLSRRKNVSAILEALSGLPAGAPRLVLAGGAVRNQFDPEAEIAARGLAGRVILTGYFPDEDLPPLYAGAECLVFPSLLEGFGLPALEAMACGTPVVTSDRGALPETTGGIRIEADPLRVESIRDGMIAMWEDRTRRAELSARGIEWASLYRWPKVAERTLAVYREVLG